MATQTAGAAGTGRSRGWPQGVSPGDWRVQLLQRVGAPVNWTNLDALQAWALSESGYNATYGTNLAGPLAYNPLAITDSYGVPTTGDVNTAGVKQFAGTAAGVDATARFLEHGYSPVIQALKDSDPSALYSAVNQSGWCAGCEGGVYPTALHSWLGGAGFQGEHGGFHGSSIGNVPSGAKGQAQAASAAHDTGGLYGACGGGTSVPLLPFSLPPFGCYMLNTVEFLVPAVGGAFLMLVGAYIVLKNTRAAQQLAQLPAAGGAVVGAAAKLTPEGRAASALRPGKAVSAGAGQPSAAERAAQRQDELHAERLKQQRARTRDTRARARRSSLQAKQEKLATGDTYRLSSTEEARIRRAQSRVGNSRPDRMAG